MFREFRDIAIEGTRFDLAASVSIDAAFGAIGTSLLGFVLMLQGGLIPERLDISDLFIVPGNPNSVAVVTLVTARDAFAAALNIGLFTNAVVQFVIVAFVWFLVIKGINATGLDNPGGTVRFNSSNKGRISLDRNP